MVYCVQTTENQRPKVRKFLEETKANKKPPPPPHTHTHIPTHTPKQRKPHELMLLIEDQDFLSYRMQTRREWSEICNVLKETKNQH